MDWHKVETAIGSAEQAGTVIGVAAISPSGDRYGHNADRRFIAASTVKIFVMIELFRQIDAGERSLNDRFVLRAEDYARGSGVMLHLHAGMEFTLNDLVYLMMSISDNTATNVLIDLVGMERINATMRRLGAANSVLARKMGQLEVPRERENWAVPSEYANAIAGLLRNEAASPAACAQMVAMLEKQQNDRRIARFLPKDDGPRWGTKTGSLAGVTNDVGFVMTAGGPLILAIFCADQPDRNLAERTIGEVSRAAWEAVGGLAP